MKKWKYLKGDERDFVGAPEWATLLTFTGGNSFFAESHSIGAKVYGIAQKDEFIIGDDGVDEEGIEIIAKRHHITDDEQDLNDCIGASEARNCSPYESRLRGGKIFDASQFLPDGYPLNGHIDCRCHNTPLGEINGTESVNYPGVDALIAERGTRYGKFKDGAAIMQELKFVMREVDGWHHLTPSQKEALDMIQHKIWRILNGDPTYDDSWKDIAGYATLIANELNGEVK